MSLVLSRKQDEGITIGGNVHIAVDKIERNRVRLRIDAPRDVRIVRDELTIQKTHGHQVRIREDNNLMLTIPTTDPRHAAAMAVLDAMHALWRLDNSSAVRWIEDTDGRVVVFTRGEYRDKIRQVIDENVQPDQMFELEEPQGREHGDATSAA